jgi:hemerythrin superfamily protein
MATTAKTSSTTKTHAKEENAVSLLKADHAKVTELFSEFEKTHTASKKKQLAGEICTALTVHAQVEEEMFYPEVKAALKDKELVPEAAVEHAVIKELVAQIEGDEEGGEMYDARVKVLSEYVKHHVKEEEGEIFPKLKQSPLDLVELGARMAERFESLRAAKH